MNGLAIHKRIAQDAERNLNRERAGRYNWGCRFASFLPHSKATLVGNVGVKPTLGN